MYKKASQGVGWDVIIKFGSGQQNQKLELNEKDTEVFSRLS